MNKTYIGLGILALAVLVIGGIYWQWQKAGVSPMDKELTAEEESLNQDISDLEELNQDTSLDNLEQDLTEIAEEGTVSETLKPATGKKIDTASIENLESELSLELSGLSTDLNDLEGFEGDTSLDELDSGLSGLTQ